MLLTGRNLTKGYGPRLLFRGITLGLEENRRVGLIGANGSGKSTLLRIFAGLEAPDEGALEARRQLRVGYVAQEDRFDGAATCADCVAAAVDAHLDAHERELRATMLLERAGFADPGRRTDALSGGWRKRLAIVRALAGEPDLLLLDEPTNHLDIDGILWLQEIVGGGRCATLTVSHDRRFLEETAERIIELGRAYPEGFLSHDGSYSDFLEKRAALLSAQAGRQQALASNVRREIQWLRRGAKARTTKAKGRIQRAGEMMADLSDLRRRNAAAGAAAIDFEASGRKTRKLVTFERVACDRGGRRLFADVNFVLAPGTKLGLLGPNGSGKSTLIRLLDGQLQPSSGEIVRADGLKVVVFDQRREQLDGEQTLRRALAPMGDVIAMESGAQHVVGWARRFLFAPEQLDMPVKELSGGEQARVLIARLMLRPADVLVLDEPTNDLDIPTLDVLENSLESFAGALLLVTHDRYLLDRLCTDLLALDGAGHASSYGDLSQWERARDAVRLAESQAKKTAAGPAPRSREAPVKKRLNWNQQRELERMDESIVAAERRVADLQAQVSDPVVMADHRRMGAACAELGTAQHEVERLYRRWAELEAIADGA